MKKSIRELIFSLIFTFLKVFGGKNFANRAYNPLQLLPFFFYQKILRFNSHVNWPVHRSSFVSNPQKIIKGTRNPGMAIGCYIDGRNGIIIGKNVWIGPYVSIISMNHDLYDYSKYIEEDPIIIGDDCWLGAHSIVLPGVQLGNHVVVAAGAVVTKSFLEDNIVIGGNPARIIKRLE